MIAGQLYLKLGGGLTAAMDDLDDAFMEAVGTAATETAEGERRFKPQIGAARFSWVYDPDLVIVPAVRDGETVTAPEVTAGPHLRVMMHPHGAPDGAYATLAQALDSWVRALPWQPMDTPPAALDRLGLVAGDIQTYRHVTQRGTSVIVRELFEGGEIVGHTTVPAIPKGVWA